LAEDQFFLYGRSNGRSKALADAMDAVHEAFHATPPVMPGLSPETAAQVWEAAQAAGHVEIPWKPRALAVRRNTAPDAESGR
jgi:hypothetical protein